MKKNHNKYENNQKTFFSLSIKKTKSLFVEFIYNNHLALDKKDYVLYNKKILHNK